jgi:hypothetical protein
MESSQQRDARGPIWASLPLMIFGLFLVAFALFNAAWPPDYVNPILGQTVSHWDRTLGKDAPLINGEPADVERPPAYEARRVVDGLAYVSLVMATLLLLGLAWAGERIFFLPLMVIGLYGLCYSVGLGMVIGPMLAAAGYTPVFLGAVLGWLMTDDAHNTNQQNAQNQQNQQGQQNHITGFTG